MLGWDVRISCEHSMLLQFGVCDFLFVIHVVS